MLYLGCFLFIGLGALIFDLYLGASHKLAIFSDLSSGFVATHMKRFITVFLMMTTLLTFTQKVMAVESFSDNAIQVINHCEMENMGMDSVSCVSDVSDMDHCQNNCEMMTVVSVLYFIENEQLISFQVSQLNYTPLTTLSAYHYSETLYRPPFIS